MWEIFPHYKWAMEEIPERLRKELERLGLSLAAAARAMGEPDAQGLRDACSGRKRVTAETLAKAVPLGVDVFYVLTGQRMQPMESTLSLEEHALLDNYKHSDEASRAAARRVLDALAQRKSA